MTEIYPEGTRLADKYTIREVVWQGPHEVLYRAQTDWGQPALISTFVIPNADAPSGQRLKQAFIRNARLLAQVQHRHVVRVLDLINEPHGPAVVFEDRLQTTLRSTLGVPLRPEAVGPITRTLFEALAAAHSQALLHARISPDTVWLDAQGEPVLGHFGLVTIALQEGRQAVASDPRYAAPERLAGGQLTPQTDIYALGATLLEVATGMTLPPASARQQGVPLPVLPAHVPGPVAQALQEALVLEASSRAVSASEVLEHLDRQVQSAQVAEEDTVPVQPEPPVETRPHAPPTGRSLPAQTPRKTIPPGLVWGVLTGLLLVGGTAAVLSRTASGFRSTTGPATVTSAAEPAMVADPAALSSAPAMPAEAADQVLRTEVVNTTTLNLRAEGNNTAAVLATLNRGASVEVYEVQGEWLRVQTSTGTRGWVNGTLTLPLISAEDTAVVVNAMQRGGTVELARGAYRLEAPLLLNRSVTVTGAGAKASVLFSSAPEDTVILQQADVTLMALGVTHIGGTPARTLLQDGGTLTLQSVLLSGAVRDSDAAEYGSGLWVKGGGEAEIDRATFTDNAFGLYVTDTSTVQVHASSFTANREGGLLFKDDSSGEVTTSAIEGNLAHGVHVFGAASPSFTENQIRRNRGRGMTVYGEGTPTVTRNTFEENGLQGIGVQDTAEPIMIKNTIQGNKESGITYFDNSGGVAQNNTIQANLTAGVRVTQYAAPTLDGNTITRNKENGIGYSDFASGDATGNTITNNEKPGISAWGDALPLLQNNVVADNRQSGIIMAERSTGRVVGNEITGNLLYGLIVTGQAAPEVVQNTVTGNRKGGIFYKQQAAGSGYGNSCYDNGGGDLLAELDQDNEGPEFSQDGCSVSY
ncbi:right-handed parallel beta-helix repeat-containing protein [Deinococcus arcticus]|uniref:Kinase n=1 Tax=Deinococcus arcticus TaxID=2136176 RepID=A0A2T3W9M4_9DEIO|nr:right-handed parallel beta-helix repeat-containing protein [Deinococcus arcticus]PTA68595.1 kinase [Deinococcus arcticus]